MNLSDLAAECLESARAHLMKTSLKSYRWYIHSFCRWIGSDCPAEALTTARLDAYLLHLQLPKAEGGRGYMPRSTRCYWMGISFFCAWLTDHGHLSENPFPRRKLPKIKDAAQPVASYSNAVRLLAACDRLRSPYRQALARVCLLLLFGAAVRRNELLSIRMQDLDFSDPQRPLLIVYFGKGGKARIVPISDECAVALSDYLALRNADCQHNYLLAHPNRQWRLAYAGLYNLLKEICLLAGFSKVEEKQFKPHALRRGGAGAQLRAGADIETVRRNLGHSSILTTQIYTRANLEDQVTSRNLVTMGKKPDPPVPAKETPPVEQISAPEPQPVKSSEARLLSLRTREVQFTPRRAPSWRRETPTEAPQKKRRRNEAA